MPREIDPVRGFLNRGQMFAFNLCVADDIDELLMAPNIMLKRRNVEITRQYGRAGDRTRPLGHAREEAKLLSEFRIHFAVGNFAASRNIDIVDPDTLCGVDIQLCAHMPRFAIRLPIFNAAVD